MIVVRASDGSKNRTIVVCVDTHSWVACVATTVHTICNLYNIYTHIILCTSISLLLFIDDDTARCVGLKLVVKAVCAVAIIIIYRKAIIALMMWAFATIDS